MRIIAQQQYTYAEVSYLTIDCGNDNEIRPRENVICKECNGRIFYKKRTRKIVQFEAR